MAPAKKSGGGLCGCLCPAGDAPQQKRASKKSQLAAAAPAEEEIKRESLRKLDKDTWRASRRLSHRDHTLVLEDNVYDVVIIGGGFSGGYCAHQLHKARPDLRLAVLEKDIDVGGRLFSDDNDEDNSNNKDELGGMRVFPSVQPEVAAMVKEMGCHLVPMRLEDADNIFYYEGTRMRKKDFKLSTGRTVSEMVRDCRAAYRKAMPEDAALPWDKAAELRKLSLPAFLRKYGASDSECDEYFCLSGYDIFSHPNVAASSFIKEGDLYGAELDSDQHYVQEGFEEVVRRMVNESGAKVGLSCEVSAVGAADKSSGLCEVKYSELKTGRKLSMFGRRVIIGLPQDAALALAKHTPALSGERLALIQDAVQLIPLFKCFLPYHPAHGTKPWWQELGYMFGKSTTDLEIRQCHYYDGEDLLIYNSGRFAEFWDNEFRKDWRKGARKMFEQVRQLHGDEAKDAPEPDWESVIFRYWNNGSHHWKTGVDVDEAMHCICHGGKPGADVKSDSPVFLVGDAFAPSQGWTAGCIETSDLALSHLLAVI